VVIADTHVLLFDALSPSRLTKKAKLRLERGYDEGALCCSDITLWEIAMLISKARIHVESDAVRFMDDILQARRINVLPITPEIAVQAQSIAFSKGDPADRLIASTALIHDADLITADEYLRTVPSLRAVW
jgi:PIN domain nuclease of toxin-antitoxin system